MLCDTLEYISMLGDNIKGWVSHSIDDNRIIGWLINVRNLMPRVAIIKINASYSTEILCNHKRSNPKSYKDHLMNGFRLYLNSEILESLTTSENTVLLIDKETNKIVAKSVISLTQDNLNKLKNELIYDVSDYDLVNSSGYFDSSYYRFHNPLLWFSRKDLLEHFLKKGGLRGKSPSLRFDSKDYLLANPNLKREGINPLVHYLKYGKKSPLESYEKKVKGISYALKYPIRIKNEYRLLLAEIKSLDNLKK